MVFTALLRGNIKFHNKATKDKKKIDELITKISRDKNFLNVVNTGDIKAWKSASEEFQAIKVDNHFLVILKPVE